ncbi:MAG: solute carrier family 26 protein [Saprospiraceae bacterium]|nr:solute carrier family 26 protein [Saprospiraceae bacterium]
MNWKGMLPVLDWGKGYNSSFFKSDLAAGLTVGVMLIPQGMAYAMIAGLPPIYGLYASTIPLIIYALLGTSRQLAVGPVAMVSLLTATGVGALAEGGTEAFIGLAILLAFMVGAIQFLMGAFRLGFLVNFLSHPVISGFTSAAALIIGISQLKHLLGIPLGRSHHFHEIVGEAISRIGETNSYALGIGVVGILVILLAKRIHKAIPAQLVAVIFGILTVVGFNLVPEGVKIVGEVPKGLPIFSVPDFSLDSLGSLTGVALAIALVSFMESIAVAKAIQAKHKDYKLSANQELVSLGLANVVGSFFQSYAVTGGFSRTAVNDQAGAKTGMASIISALLVGLTLLFLTPLFYYLPNAILASVIMVAVFGLIDWREVLHLWKVNRRDLAMLLVTFFATLGLGIEQGVLVGVILSLVMIIFQTAYPHHAALGRVKGTDLYRNLERFDDLEDRPELLVMRFDASLFFGNSDQFRSALNEYADQKGEDLKAVILNFEPINNIDSSALHVIEDILQNAKKHDINLFFSGMKGPIRDAFTKAHLLEKIGKDRIFMKIQDAVDFIDGKKFNDPTSERKGLSLQSNA